MNYILNAKKFHDFTISEKDIVKALKTCNKLQSKFIRNFNLAQTDERIILICKKCKSDWTIPLNYSWLEPFSSYKLICPICKTVFGIFITNEKGGFWGIGYTSKKENKDG